MLKYRNGKIAGCFYPPGRRNIMQVEGQLIYIGVILFAQIAFQSAGTSALNKTKK